MPSTNFVAGPERQVSRKKCRVQLRRRFSCWRKVKRSKRLRGFVSASWRQLASVTSLVADLIEEGRLKSQQDWVPEPKRIQIEHACERLGIERLRTIKDALPEEITYTEIRLVVAHIQRTN